MLELESELDSQTVQSKRLSEALDKARSENAGLAERLRLGRMNNPNERYRVANTTTSENPISSLSLRVARIVLANPIARSMVAGYFFVLHLLVMASTTAHASPATGAAASLRGHV